MGRVRKVAESGFYHVITKAQGTDLLFFTDNDRAKYLELLEKARNDHGLYLRAYCLMSNHVHLLLDDPKANLSAAMKQLNESYARHIKNYTAQAGHVYKDRFWSEPVETDEYLLCAMRYIHANPAHAGICRAAAYEWSSAKDYLGRKGIADTDLILGMLGSREAFVEFSRQDPTALPFPSSRLRGHLSEDEELRIARQLVGDPSALARLPRARRDALLAKLRSAGFTLTQITALTGLSSTTIRHATMSQR